jgi:acyl carrier protein
MTDEIRQLLIDALLRMKYSPADVTGASSLGPVGLDLESLAVADLVVQLEDAYGLKVDEDEMERFAMMTINEIAEDFASRLESAKATRVR